jgi:hypothetical protein
MPITSADFVYENETSADLAKFNLALQYLQTSNDFAGLQALALGAGTTINFVHNGIDSYDPNTGVLNWDPNSTLTVSNNGVAGIQSAALGLFHELVHRMDPSYSVETTAQREAYATVQETIMANDLGEPIRDSYGDAGAGPIETNPTEHTGGGYWQELEPDGTTLKGGSSGSAPPNLDNGAAGVPAPSGGGGTSDPGGGDPGSGGGTGTGDSGGDGDGGDGDDPGEGCVAVDSFLPDGRTAGEIVVGSTMQLADERSLEPALGEVTYSQRKTVPGVRIITQSGISLKCSTTAPIPTSEGLILAPNLLGKKVPVRRDVDGIPKMSWELIEVVESIGLIEVQHITVGDRCFWAGEKKNGYILHHNLKQPDGDVAKVARVTAASHPAEAASSQAGHAHSGTTHQVNEHAAITIVGSQIEQMHLHHYSTL